jgi:hypothetical protein
MKETSGIIIKAIQEWGKVQVSGSFSKPFSIWQERIWGGKMDGLQLREESIFTPEQEENITQHDACSKYVSRGQGRGVIFYRILLSPPPPPPATHTHTHTHTHARTHTHTKVKCDFESHRCRAFINVSNSIEEEIKERIVLGTKAYYANLKFSKADWSPSRN